MAYSCSNCGKDISGKVLAYSKGNFGKALCRDCQGEDGLSDDDISYRKNMIKGRIAETLIEELFLSLDYNVFRYGMENTVPGIMQLLFGVKNEVARNIRKMPDFVIQHKKYSDKLFFVEVKFRKSETFTREDLSDDYPFENCYFIVVSKKHIKCITYDELQEGKKITPKTRNYLGNRKEFDLDKETIVQFCDFAVKFFQEV